MKTYLFAAVIAAPLLFVGCTNEHTTTGTAAASTSNPDERTYDQHDLERSGRARTGPALETIDPSIQVKGKP